MLKSVPKASVVSWLATVALVLGVARNAEAKSPPTVTSVVSFDASLGQLPESITADDDGDVFVTTVNGEIREIRPDHSVVTVATVPLQANWNLVGIKVGPDGLLYTLSSSFTDTSAALVWRVDPDTGDAERFATLEGDGFPNDLAFDADGTFYVTDPFLARIYHVDASGNVSIFASGPLFEGNPDAPAFVDVHDFGVDGIVFDADKRNLYVGNLDYGRIIRIPVGCHGAGTPEVVAEDATVLKGMDGIAMDRKGTIYAAVNTANRIATLDRHGNVSVYVQGDAFDGPASIAFGSGHADKKTIYVANFAIGSVMSGSLSPRPGVVSLPVPVPGLELP